MFPTKGLSVKSIQISFMLTGMQLLNIAAHYSLHLHNSGSSTLAAVSNSHHIPKDTNLHQHRCTNMHCHKPTFTVLSVTDTRTAFNGCCSFNWKRRTDGNFEQSSITSALHTRDLLGSRPAAFIPVETGWNILTTMLCGSQSQSGNFGEERQHLFSLEFEHWEHPVQRIVHSPTEPVFFKKSQVEKISNLQTNGC